jgi:hypothetical protein
MIDEPLAGIYLRCQFAPYGCTWLAQCMPGDEARAENARAGHERHCVYRFHQPKEKTTADVYR